MRGRKKMWKKHQLLLFGCHRKHGEIIHLSKKKKKKETWKNSRNKIIHFKVLI